METKLDSTRPQKILLVKNPLRSPATVLLFLWLPLANGNFLGGTTEALLIPAQQVIVLGFYLAALALTLTHKLHLNKYLAILAGYVLATTAIQNTTDINAWLKVFAFIGVIVTASYICSNVSFEDFIDTALISLIFTFWLGILFSFLRPGDAFSQTSEGEALRAFYDQKNSFGRLIYFLLFFALIKIKNLSMTYRLITATLLAPTLLALDLTASRTSMAIALLLLASIPALYRFERLSYLTKPLIFFSIAALLCFIAFQYGTVINAGSSLDALSLFGFDLPLTGRATIWAGVITAIQHEGKWAFGFGLGGFFETNYAHHIINIGLGDFTPNDSHNGYLDLVLNLGLTGAAVYAFLIYVYLKNSHSIDGDSTRKTALIVFLIIYLFSNLTESFFTKTSNITSFLFLCFFIYSCKNRKSLHSTANASIRTHTHIIDPEK